MDPRHHDRRGPDGRRHGRDPYHQRQQHDHRPESRAGEQWHDRVHGGPSASRPVEQRRGRDRERGGVQRDGRQPAGQPLLERGPRVRQHGPVQPVGGRHEHDVQRRDVRQHGHGDRGGVGAASEPRGGAQRRLRNGGGHDAATGREPHVRVRCGHHGRQRPGGGVGHQHVCRLVGHGGRPDVRRRHADGIGRGARGEPGLRGREGRVRGLGGDDGRLADDQQRHGAVRWRPGSGGVDVRAERGPADGRRRRARAGDGHVDERHDERRWRDDHRRRRDADGQRQQHDDGSESRAAQRRDGGVHGGPSAIRPVEQPCGRDRERGCVQRVGGQPSERPLLERGPRVRQHGSVQPVGGGHEHDVQRRDVRQRGHGDADGVGPEPEPRGNAQRRLHDGGGHDAATGREPHVPGRCGHHGRQRPGGGVGHEQLRGGAGHGG